MSRPDEPLARNSNSLLLIVRLLVFVLLCLACAAGVRADTISGTVKDPSGAVVAGARVAEVSARFHNTLTAAIVEVCCRLRRNEGLDRVCLSGGVFQNQFLLERTVAELQSCGFGVFLHATVPANDGGISLGQAVIANELLRLGD